jgi:hypothetical protein
LDALAPDAREVHRLLSLRLLSLVQANLPAEQVANLRAALA